MTDETTKDATEDEWAIVTSLHTLTRRTPVTTGWRGGDVVRRQVVRRKRNRVIFGATATAVVAAVAITLSLTSGGSADPPFHVAAVPGTHVGARIDGAVELVSDDRAPAPADGPVAAVVRAQQLLAIELLQHLGDTGTNVSVSPESLQLALGMLQNGARGTTGAQIAKALQTPGLSTEQQDAGLAELTAELSAAARGHLRLDSANSLWLQRGFRLRRQFLGAIAPYGAGVWQTDFGTSQGLDAINHWTDVHTHGKIPELFDSLDPSTVLVLANALYLHANWATAFEPADTTTGAFTTADGRHVTTHFMSGAEGLSSATTADYDAVQLPYRGGRFAALAVMPTHQSLHTFVDDLTPSRIATIATSGYDTSTGVALPRFTTRTTSDLAPVLQALGMRQAFTPAANLSGLAAGSTQVDQVVQRVYLRVAEKGTTAAAATGISVVPTSLMVAPLRFDHPFLFLVRDTRTGAILFASEINDPTAG